jgi:hypothetical protein
MLSVRSSTRQSQKAEKFYEEAALIVSALELYKNERGSYPASIDDLIPKYILKMPNLKFYYVTENDTYIFVFKYEGPGVNSCKYSPGKGWDCTGLI